MPTPTQVANRSQQRPPDRHAVGTVTAAGPPYTVTLDPGGAETPAVGFVGAAHPVGAKVLVVLTHTGNWILGRIS